MAKTVIALLLSIVLGCGDAPREPRDLQAFKEHSRACLARATPRELTGFDPVKEWALLLWVERSAEAGDRSPDDAPLFLNGITTLDRSEAAELARHPGSRIFLPDLGALDANTAAALASPRHELYLDGLRHLDVATAKALVAGGPRSLSFRSLSTLDIEAGEALAELKGTLRLDGLRDISPRLAAVLARWDGYGEQVVVSLGGLAELHPAVARELARCRGWGLSLSGVSSLTPEAAHELGRLPTAYLALDGVGSLSRETATAISKWERKFLTLDGITSIHPEIRALVEAGCEATSFRSLAR